MQKAIHHHQNGNIQQAELIYREVLKVEPKNVYALNLLGVIAKQTGQYELAVRLFRKALKIKPNFEEAYNNLGNTFLKLENQDEAAGCFRHALAINPYRAAIHNNLGNVLNERGQVNEAAACYRKALALEPNYANAYNNLGKLLKNQGDLDQAAACYRKALAIKPDLVEACNNLGNVLNEQGQLSAAIASYKKAVALKPDYAKAYNNLGRVLKDQGRLDEAIAVFRKALALGPDLSGAHSNLLFTLNYLPDCSQEEIYKESRRWNDMHAAPLQQNYPEYENSRDPGRRLRIGYVSPDFRTHSVAYFIEPVIKAHDRGNLEIFCYANVIRVDEVTERIRGAADHWFSIAGRSDAEVADRIRQDRIDILVDLTGHTGGNRLLVFALRPAPVQVSWLGYPNTTGLSAIDYRLTDAIADPVGEADGLHSEELVRLEHGFLCFQADESAPDVTEPPCLDKGYVTFGNFNDLAKTTSEVVQLWAKILAAVPGSRLLMKAKQLVDAETRERYRAMFIAEGVAGERIELHGRLPKKKDHLAFYSRIDIGLDPFPYNGTTTTCEALWMGVPVVTWRGDRHAERVGASILHRVGLPELIAHLGEEYIKTAAGLALDRERLQELRSGLRDRMRKSKLMDMDLFTASLEDAYRNMWYAWCKKSDN